MNRPLPPPRRTASIIECPPLMQAHGRYAQIAFVVAVLEELVRWVDPLDGHEQSLQQNLRATLGTAVDALVRSRKIVDAVRAVAGLPCPCCGAASPRQNESPQPERTTPAARGSTVTGSLCRPARDEP